MTPSLVSALTALIPLAMVIALSPLSVIPAVLVLSTPNPRRAGLAFLVGWLISLATLTAIFVASSGLLGGLHKSPPAWASWLRIVVGAALIVFGGYRWFTRQHHTEMPRWMRSFAGMTPARAGLTAIALAAVRLEVSLMCAAAGLAVGSAGLERADAVTAAAFFVAVAASTVAVPILAYLAAGERLHDALTRLQNWMEQQHAAMLAITLVVIGLMVVHNGIHAL